MSGGSQHNPNGRQAQIGAAWSPLQLQVASLLARAPQAHMSSDRGVTWHTPTPPPHLYHVPAPSPPDPLQALQLQAMKGASVFRHMLEPTSRHSVTPPDLYRHTPTPPDKHLMRHTPSPGEMKAAVIPPVDLFPHLGPSRDKVPRPEELLSLARGVDLSVSRGPPPALAPPPPAAHAHAAHATHAAHAHSAPALLVRDAPTINSLIARAQPRAGAGRVDSLLSRLGAPVSPHSVIVHARTDPPSPYSSNEDSADSCGAPPGSKRKRKPERTARLGLPPTLPLNVPAPASAPAPLANGDALRHNGPQPQPEHSAPEHHSPEHVTPAHDTPAHDTPAQTQSPPSPIPQKSHTRRKSSNSETIDDIAAMIKNPDFPSHTNLAEVTEVDAPVTIDKLKSVLTNSTEEQSSIEEDSEMKRSPATCEAKEKDSEAKESVVEAAAAPKRRAATTSNSESTNVPVESPSEGKPAETSEEPLSEARTAEPHAEPNTAPSIEPTEPTAEPVAANFVEVENQLQKMFAGLDEVPTDSRKTSIAGQRPPPKISITPGPAPPASRRPAPPIMSKLPISALINSTEKSTRGRKRRKSAPTKGEPKPGRRDVRAITGEGRRKGGRGRKAKGGGEGDDGSSASSGRGRGPYVQIRGPRASPLSVCVVNANSSGAPVEDDGEAPPTRRKEFRNGLRIRGLHQSTLGLRYDATTADATWLCAFCQRGPHAKQLGDLFGPYTIDTDCEEYRSLEESTRHQFVSGGGGGGTEVWTHEVCAVWAPGVLGGGARLWGLAPAVWTARGNTCDACQRHGATLACRRRGCPARSHFPCASAAHWTLDETKFLALCPEHCAV